MRYRVRSYSHPSYEDLPHEVMILRGAEAKDLSLVVPVMFGMGAKKIIIEDEDEWLAAEKKAAEDCT